ncbi:MAG: PstS family phosphate ABC transporter substrate-binding protein [Crocosphaera sp.]|nr:PstS family phosphate ABC transporter substrate-binding protein [Crocosphaera sp.]
MAITTDYKKQGLAALTFGALMAVTLSSCTSVDSVETSEIEIDGSSTVYPISHNVVEEFQATQRTQGAALVANVDLSGTGAGFEKFCRGETDMNNASRPIQKQEMKACDQSGVRYIELIIGLDAITVVVNPENDFAKDMTLEELKKVWEPQAEGKITHWNQIRESWPNQPINLYGPGRDSGTFDYFTEAVIKKKGEIRSDYTVNKNPNILVQKISEDMNALGYFGYGYYKVNDSRVTALAIKNGEQSVVPSRYNIKWDQYRPLSRPLFIYVNMKASQDKPSLREFVHFYLENAPEFVSDSGYIPLPKEGYQLSKQHFETGKVGTVFEGNSQVNLTMDELLKKEAAF